MDDAFAWPQADHLLRVAVRLLAATVLGGLIGLEREQTGKAAGLRTHMLVALGSALFTLAPREAGMPLANISAVVQGVVTGIGFVGAGAILKSSSEERVVGLTTATTVWLTAAVGVAAALQQVPHRDAAQRQRVGQELPVALRGLRLRAHHRRARQGRHAAKRGREGRRVHVVGIATEGRVAPGGVG